MLGHYSHAGASGYAVDAPGSGGRGTAGELARHRVGKSHAPPLAQRVVRSDKDARTGCGTSLNSNGQVLAATVQTHQRIHDPRRKS